MRRSGAVVSGLAIALGMFALAATSWRVRFGVDLQDEAFHVALPYRFALGDQPFVDELSIGQTAGLLAYPFVKIYVTMVGSSTGLVLFLRALYVGLFAVAGWTAFELARARLPFAPSLLIGSACVAFVPYGIPGLSYNTVSMGGFAIGAFVVARWLLMPRPTAPAFIKDPLAWAGFAHAAAAFAYPTFLVPALATGLAILACAASGARRRGLLRFAGGGLCFTALIAPVVLAAGHHLRDVYAYSSVTIGDQSVYRREFLLVMREILGEHPELVAAVAVLALLIVLARRWPSLTILALPMVPWLSCSALLPVSGPMASSRYLTGFALLAPILALALRDRRAARTLLLAVWTLSAIAGVLTAWSSANGAVAASLGLLPAAIVSAVFLALWIDEAVTGWRLGWPRELLALSAAVFPAILIHCEWLDHAVYLDGPLPELTARVTEGPYQGLFTTPQKKAWLREVSANIERHKTGERSLFYYRFPAGYLIANQRPLAASAWIFPIPRRAEFDARYFREHATPGELVMHVVGRDYDAATALAPAIAEQCDEVERAAGFTMWVVKAKAADEPAR